jgi:hypothetical protein
VSVAAPLLGTLAVATSTQKHIASATVERVMGSIFLIQHHQLWLLGPVIPLDYAADSQQPPLQFQDPLIGDALFHRLHFPKSGKSVYTDN